MNRSSGPAGKPSGAPPSGVSGFTMSGEFGTRAIAGGVPRGYGALWRKPPGRSIVPSRVIRIDSARIVWKPFECAASPRIAWKATGLPVTRSCFTPQESVQAIGSSILWSRAITPSSVASRRIVSAGMPVMPAAHSGVFSTSRSASSWKAGFTGVPSCSRKLPNSCGSLSPAWLTTGLPV